jgi:hypothetical protein
MCMFFSFFRSWNGSILNVVWRILFAKENKMVFVSALYCMLSSLNSFVTFHSPKYLLENWLWNWNESNPFYHGKYFMSFDLGLSLNTICPLLLQPTFKNSLFIYPAEYGYGLNPCWLQWIYVESWLGFEFEYVHCCDFYMANNDITRIRFHIC